MVELQLLWVKVVVSHFQTLSGVLNSLFCYADFFHHSRVKQLEIEILSIILGFNNYN